MAREKLEIWITLKDRVTKGIQAVGKTFALLRGGVDRLKTSVFNLRNAFIAISTFFVGQRLISYANEQAKAVLGMEAALRSMGNYTPELSQELQQIASDIQGITNYGDEAILMGQKFLITYKDIGLDLMPRVSMAMADLAALMGGDMRQAANMLGKASMGMTGELRRVGITVDASVYKMEGFVGVLKAIENQSKGQALAMRAATGSMVAMSNSFLDAKEKAGDFLKIMLEPAFQVLLDRFDALNESIAKLKEEGRLDEWANEMSTKVMGSLEFMVMGTLSVYETMVPIMRNFKNMFSTIWDWFKTLPSWVQTSGLVLAIMGGRNVKLTLFALAAMGKAVEEVQDEIKAATYEWSAGRSEIENYVMKLEALRVVKERLSKVPLFGEDDEELAERLRKLKLANEQIAITENLIRQLTPIKIFPEDEGLGDISAVRSAVIKMFEDIEKRRKKLVEELSKPVVAAAPAARPEEPKALPLDLATEVSKQLLSLEVLYQSGEEELIAYLKRRETLVLLALGAEMGKLEEAAKAERDVAKRLAIEDQLFIKRQEYALKEIEMAKAIDEAREESFNRRTELEGMFADLKSRTDEDLTAIQAAELAEMDERHRKELESFKTLLDDKLAAEMGYIDKASALENVRVQQNIEKDKLINDQKKDAFEEQLKGANRVAGGLKAIAEDLYVASGKQSKKMFTLMKGLSIVQATIKMHEAIVGALGSPPYGWAAIGNAALAGAMGAAQIAAITTQSFAEGGLIPGSSSHSKADNVQINATAGEYMQPVSSVKYYGKRVMEGIKNLAFPREMFSGFSFPSFASAGSASRTHYAEGGAISALSKVKLAAPKIEIVNVTNPDAIRGLAMDAIHENRDIVVNMVLQGLEDRNITLYKEF
ncbi:MAG: hypothetical protein KAS32_30515 [Candidatus Peribacteraceae bacterium]|nr:hypothetical protein [Candidatus Peribacteraceae bacterium]